jgi:hypothetical protein
MRGHKIFDSYPTVYSVLNPNFRLFLHFARSFKIEAFSTCVD